FHVVGMDREYQRRLFGLQKGSEGCSRSPSSPRRSLFSSPTKNRTAADRLIPMRANSNWGVDFSMIGDSQKPDTSDGEQKTSAYRNILRNELFGDSSEDSENIKVETKTQSPFKNQNLFNYSPRKNKVKEPFTAFSLSPVSARSQKLLSSP
ncbi:unnamed protein product, partial [Meganyctiphanes norvegica]